MQSFWTMLVAVSMFTAAYVPETGVVKAIGFGLLWLTVLLIVSRRGIANWLGYEETKPMPGDREKQVKTGKFIKPGEDFTERLILLVCSVVILGSLWYFVVDQLLVNIITIAAMCAIGAVSARRTHDFSERGVHPSRINVFHCVPIVVSMALFGAYISGVSVWFVIGFAILTGVGHLWYGHILDVEEAAQSSNVVQLDTSKKA